MAAAQHEAEPDPNSMNLMSAGERLLLAVVMLCECGCPGAIEASHRSDGWF